MCSRVTVSSLVISSIESLVQHVKGTNSHPSDAQKQCEGEAMQAASHFSHLLLVLRGPAGSLGFEGLLAAHVNFDLLGLGFGLLGEPNLQHALTVVGAHLLRVH